MRRNYLCWAYCLTVLLSSCGGGVSGENGDDPFGSDTDDTSTDTAVQFGSFDEDGTFVEGEVGVNLTAVNGIYEISAGGSIGLSVVVVDEDNARVSDSYSVSFSSNCVLAEKASIDTDINTVNGEASSTYTDLTCAGSSGTVDQISATVVIDDETLTATQEITILPEVIGSISFVSASPESILLQGAGDASASISNVTFVVSNDQTEAIEGQVVEFSLSTEIGGLALDSSSGVTNTDGEVVAEVIAGNVPTAVRVSATVEGANGESLNTQSDAISVTTGLPNQQSFSLATDIFNIEGDSIDGSVANITARLSDTFGNPVPDDTVINFTAEGGQIESSCLTLDGACSVTWTSANPRTEDGIITILATAIGHETLFDSNGNNIYDQADGDPIDDDSDSGRLVSEFTRTGFVDMAEAWRDDDRDLEWDAGEPFFDYNNNQQYDLADGLFNGPQCGSPELCGQGVASTIHVRKSFPLFVSGSTAFIDLFDAVEVRIASNYQTPFAGEGIILSRGETVNLSVLVADRFGNIMPADTDINVSSSAGTITFTSGTVVPNASSTLGTRFTFTLGNELDDDAESVEAVVSIFITTPSGAGTTLQFNALLQ